MKAYGPDFYNISELLAEEELMIQKTAYDFVQTEFMPLVGEHYDCLLYTSDAADD